MKENPWINRIISAVFAIGMAVSGYFLNETMGTIKEVENRVYSLEIKDATITGNRFTSSDWMTQKSLIDADKLATERRITKLEEAIPTIKESLIRIELAIDKKNGTALND